MNQCYIFKNLSTLNCIKTINCDLRTCSFNSNRKRPKSLKSTDKTHIKYSNLINNAKNATVKIDRKYSTNNTFRYLFLEGKLLIEEAVKVAKFRDFLEIDKIFYTNSLIKTNCNIENLKIKNIIKIDDKILKQWSNVKTSQGIIAIARFFEERFKYSYSTNHSLQLSVLLDNVRDPGNMGTIIRTAAAIGFDRILMTKGCVDPWSPKVLRCAMGSHFHIPLYTRLDNEQTNYFLNKSNLILLADINSNSNSINILNKNNLKNKFGENKFKHITLVIGSESTGISENIQKYTNKNSIISSIKIPLSNNVESLNCAIAFAILGYELRKLIIDDKYN